MNDASVEAAKIMSNFEIHTQSEKVVVFVDSNIFDINTVKTAAKQFEKDSWVTIETDGNGEVLVELKPKEIRDLAELARQFNNELIKNTTLDMPVSNPNLLAKIRSAVNQIIAEEQGSIQRNSVLALGGVLAGVGIMGSLADPVGATHNCPADTPPVDVDTSDGDGSDGGDCCFPAGVEITMADGTVKNIEDVQVGESVLAYNEETREVGEGKVQGLLSRVKPGYYNINEGALRLTDDHPVYVSEDGTNFQWGSLAPKKTKAVYNIDAKPIQRNSWMYTTQVHESNSSLLCTKKLIKVESIEYIEGTIQTYHLRDIEGFHTFFANNVLVHNSDSDSGCSPVDVDTADVDTADGDDK